MQQMEVERSINDVRDNLEHAGSAGWAIDRLIFQPRIFTPPNTNHKDNKKILVEEPVWDKLKTHKTNVNFLLIGHDLCPDSDHHFISAANAYPVSLPNKAVFIFDLSSRWLYELTQERRFRSTKIDNFPHPTESIDYIFFDFNVYTTQNPEFYLEEAKRVLTKDGLILIPTHTTALPEKITTFIPKAFRKVSRNELNHKGLKNVLRSEVNDRKGRYELIVFAREDSAIHAVPGYLAYSNKN